VQDLAEGEAFWGRKVSLRRAWETQTSTSNSSPNFQVIADNETGLLFKNKRDRKVINVDPKSNPGDNSTRNETRTHAYAQIVLYDHMTRHKG